MTTSTPTITTTTTKTTTTNTQTAEKCKYTWKDCSSKDKIEQMWMKMLSYVLDQKRTDSERQTNSICVDYSRMDKTCNAQLGKDGYHSAKATISDTDSDNLASIIQSVFENRKGNSECTHWETGTQRLSLYMNKQHFFNLAEQSYEEHTNKKAAIPYKFVEHLPVWASELTTSSVETVLRVMRAASERVGAEWTQEFEAVMTGANGDSSPQMWHFDGTFACLAAVGVLPCPGINGGLAVRDSTEFVRYVHRRLSEFDTDQEKMAYLETVWKRIVRTKIKTQNQFNEATRQDQIAEVLTEGNEMIGWTTSRGDMTVFLTDHLHRGASSKGIGYAYFCAWEVLQQNKHTHTDGLPMHYTNWRAEFTKLFKNLEEEKSEQTKFQLDEARAARKDSRSRL
jgi:hypothetical protein